VGIDKVSIEIGLKSGMAFVCVICSRMREAIDKGLDGCGVAGCGGPMAGKTFPGYRGSLDESNWTEFCFVCGRQSDAGINVKGSNRMLGVCAKHVHLVTHLKCVEIDRESTVSERDVQMIIKSGGSDELQATDG